MQHLQHTKFLFHFQINCSIEYCRFLFNFLTKIQEKFHNKKIFFLFITKIKLRSFPRNSIKFNFNKEKIVYTRSGIF